MHVADIEKKYSDGETVSFKTLLEKKLVKDISNGVKVLGPGKLTKNLKFSKIKLTKQLLEQSKKLQVKPDTKPVVKKSSPPKTNKVSKTKKA